MDGELIEKLVFHLSYLEIWYLLRFIPTLHSYWDTILTNETLGHEFKDCNYKGWYFRETSDKYKWVISFKLNNILNGEEPVSETENVIRLYQAGGMMGRTHIYDVINTDGIINRYPAITINYFLQQGIDVYLIYFATSSKWELIDFLFRRL